MQFYTEKDLAVCGLACALCSDEDCPGCKARGRSQGGDCSVYLCAAQKGIDGCYQCDAFPCQEDMLKGIRNRAFNRYAKQYGKQALLERLQANYENGITYHKPDGSKGDYDVLETEDDIYRLVRFGACDPFKECPVFESARFTLRLVSKGDAEDLYICYSDPKAQEILNADRAIQDFRHRTLEEMEEWIDYFLSSYADRDFIRFSIVDKQTGHAVGTVEMFDATGQLTECDARAWGVLRLDLASQYEKQPYIEELLTLCLPPFYGLFSLKLVVTLAIPAAKERISALRALDFEPFDWPNGARENYWIHNKV